MVQERLPGRPPRHADEWARVIDVLRMVHESTRGWAQRPGFAAGRDLQTRLRGGDVDLAAMPADAVALVRRAWRSIDHGPLSAIHGDPGGGNVLVDDRGGIGLIDWDESRVDVPWFDFALLPGEVPTPTSRGRLMAAGVAWEAATCWVTEPGYAAGRLDELRRRATASTASRGRPPSSS
jgi:aminoglycoside phosphotransferase (APT) family kinase protein